MFWIRIGFNAVSDPDTALYLSADPEPDLDPLRMHANQDTDPGQNLSSLKVEFYMKTILYGGKRP